MRHAISLVLCLLATNLTAADLPPALSDKSFEKHKGSRGVLLFHVNWGRQWGCHDYENAQLQKLSFQMLPVSGDASPEIVVNTPSKLLSKDAFRRYALFVHPGEYALSGFRVKLARSVSDLRIYEADASRLIEDGKPKGGSFQIAAGEIVYIGHFGVDCNGEPAPWRFYIEGEEEFRRYSAEFHREFPSTRSTAVTFRLLETDVFGTPYSLPAAGESEKAVDPAP